MNTSARYVWLVLGLVAVVLLPGMVLNLMLASSNQRFDKNSLASEWQQAQRGVTYAPPITYNRPFKTLRLNARMPEIDAVVFGSSTAMGITAAALEPYTAYNFAQTGNALLTVIGEAEDVVARWGDRVRLLVIPLDWALGFVHQSGTVPVIDLSEDAARAAGRAFQPDYAAQLQDALSAPRWQDLFKMLRDALSGPQPLAALRTLLFEPAGAEYRCADGTPARDYDTLLRGRCVGFRYDGSATFADQKRIMPAQWAGAVAAAAASSSQYARALRATSGEPNPEILRRLAALAARIKGGGGQVLFLFPPLLPGVEQALLDSAHSGASLRRTKKVFNEWARASGLTLLDAGAAERFGCEAVEFIDPHHALPECYLKVLAPALPVQLARAGTLAHRPVVQLRITP